MAVVLGANLLVALVVDDHRASVVAAQLQRWIDAEVELHAPALLPDEVANGVTRLVAAGAFPAALVPTAWQAVLRVPLIYHPHHASGDLLIEIALRLGRVSAYDAAYLAVAEEVGADLWTFDGPLARNASGLGFVVHLIS